MISWINAEQKTRRLDFTVINGDPFHNDVNFFLGNWKLQVQTDNRRLKTENVTLLLKNINHEL